MTHTLVSFWNLRHSMQNFPRTASPLPNKTFPSPLLNPFPSFPRKDTRNKSSSGVEQMEEMMDSAKIRTCGFTRTRSMNKTTKSCSTYLSANRLQRGHCVNLTSPPPPPPLLPLPFPPAFRFPDLSVPSRAEFNPGPDGFGPKFPCLSCTGLRDAATAVTDCLE